jgi:beta-carotene hydroxylase
MTESNLTFQQATQRARAHERPIAWPTVALALVFFAAFWGIAWGAGTGALPIWAAIIVNTFVAYAAYTPLHEAVHGNVHQVPGRGQSQGSWLNDSIGFIASAPLLHSFPMHQVSHLAHHVHTNDPERDPDHWMAVRGAWPVTWRALTLLFAHYANEWRLCAARPDGSRRRLIGLMQNLLWLAIVTWLALTFDTVAVLLATVLAAWLGSALLAITFDWMPHTPHTERGRFRDTFRVVFPAALQPLLTRILLYQNYHHIHHLWPRVPFFAYAQVHEQLADYLSQQGATAVDWRGQPLVSPLPRAGED